MRAQAGGRPPLGRDATAPHSAIRIGCPERVPGAETRPTDMCGMMVSRKLSARCPMQVRELCSIDVCVRVCDAA